MATTFEQLMRGIQNAVVEASHRMRQQQQQLITDFFDPVERPVDAAKPELGTSTRYEPKLARFALPVDDGDQGHVKDVWVPLIAMVPQSALAIDEVRIVTEIELSVEEGEALDEAELRRTGAPEGTPPPARILARTPPPARGPMP